LSLEERFIDFRSDKQQACTTPPNAAADDFKSTPPPFSNGVSA